MLYLAPRHVCPTVNLAEAALLVDGPPNNRSFARLEIEARAHPLFADEEPVSARDPVAA